jgi:hypothetical protein
MNWQPIETAPKDGTKIIAIEFEDSRPLSFLGPNQSPVHYEPRIVWWQDTTQKRIVDAPELGEGVMKWEEYGHGRAWVRAASGITIGAPWTTVNPTHWLPLPEFPPLPEEYQN